MQTNYTLSISKVLYTNASWFHFGSVRYARIGDVNYLNIENKTGNRIVNSNYKGPSLLISNVIIFFILTNDMHVLGISHVITIYTYRYIVVFELNLICAV